MCTHNVCLYGEPKKLYRVIPEYCPITTFQNNISVVQTEAKLIQMDIEIKRSLQKTGNAVSIILLLGHCIRETPKRVIGKQCRP